jgi:hypothetical protein
MEVSEEEMKHLIEFYDGGFGGAHHLHHHHHHHGSSSGTSSPLLARHHQHHSDEQLQSGEDDQQMDQQRDQPQGEHIPQPPSDCPSARRDLSFYDDSPPSSLRSHQHRKQKYKRSLERFIGKASAGNRTPDKADSWDGVSGGGGMDSEDQHAEDLPHVAGHPMKESVSQMVADAEKRKKKREDKERDRAREREKEKEKKENREREREKEKEKRDEKKDEKEREKEKGTKEKRVKRSTSAFGLFGTGGSSVRRKVRKEEREREKERERERETKEHAADEGDTAAAVASTATKDSSSSSSSSDKRGRSARERKEERKEERREEREKDRDREREKKEEKVKKKHGSLPAKASVSELKHGRGKAEKGSATPPPVAGSSAEDDSVATSKSFGAAIRAIVSGERLDSTKLQAKEDQPHEKEQSKAGKSSSRRAIAHSHKTFVTQRTRVMVPGHMY